MYMEGMGKYANECGEVVCDSYIYQNANVCLQDEHENRYHVPAIPLQYSTARERGKGGTDIHV